MKAFSVFGSGRRGDNKPADTVEAYFLRTARRIRAAKLVLAAVIVIFSLFAFTVNRSQMTVSNLRYMLKYIDFISPASPVENSEVYFDADDKTKLSLLRGNPVVLDGSGLSVYDRTGRVTLHENFAFSNPAIIAGEKYVYAYDLGGGTNTLKIFNSYAELYSCRYDNPVLGVSVNDDGDYCVITADKGYASGVKVYDSDNRIIYSKQFGDVYTVAAALGKDAAYVLTATVTVDDGDYVCELSRCDTTKEQVVNVMRYLGELPLDVSYFDDGGFVFITDRAVRFFDADCSVVEERFFGSESAKRYFSDDEYAIITYATQIVGNSTRLSVLGSDGEEVFSEYYEGDVLGASVGGSDVLYVLTTGTLHSYSLRDGNSSAVSIDRESAQLIVTDDYVAVGSEKGMTVIVSGGVLPGD